MGGGEWGGREVVGSNFEALLEPLACGGTWTVSPGRTLLWSPSNRRTACWRRKRERACEADVQLCPARCSAAHCEPLERACAEQSLGQAGGGRSCFLATLINLLGVSPSEGIRLDSPWREATPLQECWAAAFSHSPKFLGWNKITGECCIIFPLIIRCRHTARLQRPYRPSPPISPFLVLLVVSRHNAFYRTSSFFLKLNK